MPVTPTPPAQPLNPATPATNQNPFSTSGIPASGVDGSALYCSAMHFKEQSMVIQYKRVPIGSLNWATSDVSLTGVNIGGVVDRTVLVVDVMAYATGYVVSGECWETPAFVQSQKFNMNTVSAVDGISYGTVGAGKMGPAGEIFNPASGVYISRQPYQSTIPIPPWMGTWGEYLMTGLNFAIVDVSGRATCAMVDTYPNVNPNQWWGTDNFLALATKLGQNATRLCGAVMPQFELELGAKFGAYSTSQDAISDMQMITDAVGVMVREGHLVGYNNVSAPALPHYDPGLHYWGP